MGRKSARYESYCARIHEVVDALIQSAISSKLQKFIDNHADIHPFVAKRAEVIDTANIMVRNIDPSLKVSGPLMTKSVMQWTPRWADSLSNWKQVWHSNWVRMYHVFQVEFEHKPMLKVEGGAFKPIIDRYNLHHLIDTENEHHPLVLRDEGDLIILDEASRNAALWADKQYRLMWTDFNEWTEQFSDYTAKRAVDLAFYFSPVFASFSSSGSAKVFRQRPRVDDYQPMSNELATLLTMARASNHYDPSNGAFRNV
jgi:hypothetical protein